MLVNPSAANAWINLSKLSSITGSLVVTNTTADISSRGVGAGTFYYQFTKAGNGASIIIVHSYWEER